MDFQTAYLSGFLADKYDVDAKQSEVRANERIHRSTEEVFASTVNGYTTVYTEGSRIKLENGKSRLMLTVFIRELLDGLPEKNPNSILLSGYICKPPIYRTTPFNREIADVLVAVNRAYNKSDYIPCIAWGRNARFVRHLEVGQNIKIWGRMQSREYQKKITETESIAKTAYEVSINRLEIGDVTRQKKEATSLAELTDENGYSI